MTETDVVVVDCQATGANPERDHLLEVAWSTGRAGAMSTVASRLVRLPAGERIPRRVTTLTGLRDADLAPGCSPTEATAKLAADARPGACVVAHFARFERAYLETALPQLWICTHEIACRLLPGLPRRGLRAVAGYFGHVMGESRRAAAHVRATAAVWEAIVERLSAEADVFTLADLRAWMERVEPARRTGKDFPLSRETRLGLPDAPGVYRLLGKGGQVLYLGKATSLKRRVNSHFTHRGKDRSREMLAQAWDVEVAVTGSPLEAALRETDEIKECAPPYNVALRERQPRTWFASTDLARTSAHPDAVHRIGPLPRRDALEPLAILRDAPPFSDERWVRALGVRPDPGELAHGFARFCARHGLRDTSLHRLRRLGRRLWRAKREDEEQEDKWCALLESVVARCTHLARRGPWLSRLAESSLLWQPRGRERPRILVLQRGSIALCMDADEAPAPRARPVRERQRCMDPATYDRLRVLTTELRRVLAEGGPVELRTGSRRLGRRELSRRLAWV